MTVFQSDVPPGWKQLRVKNLARVIGKGSGQASDVDPLGNVSYLTPEDLGDRVHASPDRRCYSTPIGQSGDLALVIIASVGKVGRIDRSFASNPQVISIRALDCDPAWFAYLAKAIIPDFKRNSYMDAVVPFSSGDNFLRLRAYAPPLPTQRAIANYLDRETARIDALIEKKTRFIELLEEKQQALITQAVTKGLDPDVPMKDSGVEWIGQVPAHWSVVKLKRIAKLRSGDSIPTDEVSDDGRYPVYGSGGRRGYTSKFTNTESAVVVGRQGSCGKVTYAEGPFWASEHAVVVYPKMAAPMMWLGENLRTARLERYSNSAAQPGFGVADVVEEFFPLPTEHERWAIDQHIRERSSTITSLKNKTIQSVELLRERRSALITAAVTGQLDIGEDA